MVKIDFDNYTYTCPFCGHAQAFSGSYKKTEAGYNNMFPIPEGYKESSLSIYTLKCSNKGCEKITVIAKNHFSKKQYDIIPSVVIKHFPDYIPQQLRCDYEEASLILESSPKAAATLLRRCLQGMIRDFWGINGETLFNEINQLKDKISITQWNAIDALRKIGNIGAHMEKDVNIIIDIDEGEAKLLLGLIELLFEKWYIARHDEEELLNSVSSITIKKERLQKNNE